jgi:hypothetical protein
VRGCDLKADALDATGRQDLQRLVAASGVAAPQTSEPSHARVPADRDVTEYEIDVESSTGRHRATLTDRDLDGPAGPLIRFLQQRARPMALDS